MSRRIFVPTLHSIFSNANNRYNNALNRYRDYENRLPDYRIEEDEKSYCIEMDMPGVKKWLKQKMENQKKKLFQAMNKVLISVQKVLM